MRFIIIFALLCYSCAEGQTTPAVQAEGHQPPQHIKDYVEQHVNHAKQQIPIIQQQIKEDKVKVEIVKPSSVNDHQVPDNIKEFINSHINQVLQYVAKQKGKKPLSVPTSTLGVPQFVVEEIKALQNHVRNIVKQVETHIPQVINKQIGYRKQIKDKQEVPEVVVEKNDMPNKVETVGHHVSTRSIKDDVKVIDNVKEQKDVANKPVVIPSLVQEIVHQVSQHVPQVISQQIAQVQKKDVVSQIVSQEMNQKKVEQGQEKPVVSTQVQEIVKPNHQHVPQVTSPHVSQVQKKVLSAIAKDQNATN